MPHPFCVTCGLIKSIGSDRSLKKGDLANLVADLSGIFTATGRKVTEAQRRLIHRAMSEQDVDDPFAHTRAGQIALVVEAFSQHTGIPCEAVVSHLEQLSGPSGSTRRR